MSEDAVREKLIFIQQHLKAPKGQFNTFGKYNYRSCEDILEAVKPLLGLDSSLTISDDIVQIGNRYYVKATATLWVGSSSFPVTAFAREEDDKKGMDASQITGAASSYARKYALNGLFLIDDTKDADTQDNTGNKPPPKQKEPEKKQEPPAASPADKPKLDQKQMQLAVKDMLIDMYVNEVDAYAELYRMTTWTKPDGSVVEGRKTPFELGVKENDKHQTQTSVTYHQVQRAWTKWKEAQDADHKPA